MNTTVAERRRPGETRTVEAEFSHQNGAVATVAPQQARQEIAVTTDSPSVQTAMPDIPSSSGFANIAKAIAGVMIDLRPVEKAGFNKFHSYRYAKMEDILQELTPLLGKHGLVIIPTERSKTTHENALSVVYSFTIIHTSGEIWFERPQWTGVSRMIDSKGGFDDKAINKCATAAQKYFLKALFNIPTSDDADADSHDTGSDRQSPAKKPVPSPTGRIAPHAIPTKGESFPTWGDKYRGFIAKASSHDELTQWDSLNDVALGEMNAGNKALYNSLMDEWEARSNELKARGETATTQEKEPPQQGQQQRRAVPSPTQQAQAEPAQGGEDDQWLEDLETAFAAAGDLNTLVAEQTNHMAPMKGQVSDEVWKQAEAVLQKYVKAFMSQ